MTNRVTKHTNELEVGDVVLSHFGARLLIDSEPQVSKNHPVDERRGACRYVAAKCINLDEVRAECEARGDFFMINHMDKDEDGTHRWTIQGNDLAAWLVETDA